MIAIVILGIGLLTIAAMFPIAWTKARDLSDFTNQISITDSAEVAVRMLTRVTSTQGSTPVGSSFIGDIGLNTIGQPTPLEQDPYVHVLHIENLSFDGPWSAGRSWPAFSGPPRLGEYYAVEYLTLSGEVLTVDWPVRVSPDLSLGVYPTGADAGDAPPPPQIAFYQRVFPPLPPPPEDDGTSPESEQWQELLQQRRLCWAVLHKMNYDPTAVPEVGDPRSFTMYYVTLRRGQSTHRFARQDPGPPAGRTVPQYGPADAASTPMNLVALGKEEDVMFPVPWRAQITLVDATPADPATIGLPGVPSQATVTSSKDYIPATADMMPRSSYLVDELTGDIYHVAKHELSQKAAVAGALLTFEEAVEPGPLDDDKVLASDPTVVDPEERLRTVWVFPPPVERDASGKLIGFAGPQPVVGIEVRTMDFRP